MAVTDATARFAVEVKDGATAGSMSAKKAIDSLKTSITTNRAQLGLMNKALKDMTGGSKVNQAAVDKLKAAIAAKKQAVADAAVKLDALGGSMEKTKTKSKAAAGSSVNLTAVLGKLGIKTMALPLAFAALAAGIGVAIAAMARYAMAQVNARRDESIQLEGLSKIRDWYGRAATGAGELQSQIDAVSGSVSLGRGEIAGYQEQLYRMGLRGENLKQALTGVAKVASVQGAGDANLFMSMAASASFAGQSVKRLADDVEARLGGTVQKKMLSFDVQMTKLKENLSVLFSGVGITKFLQAINMVVGMFSQAEATGRAWKVVMEALFQPLFDGLGTGAPLVKRFIQGVTIAVLSLMIATIKAKHWLEKTFDKPEWMKSIDAGTAAVWAGYAAVVALGVGLALIVGPIVAITAAAVIMGTALAVALVIAAAPAILLGIAIYGIYTAVVWAWDKLKEFGAWFESTKWGGIAMDMIRGLVNGIKSGATLVWNEMKALGDGAAKSFRETLGIHSPSLVFKAAGKNISEGVAQGIDSGRPQVDSSMEGMTPSPAATGSGSAASNGPSVVIQNLTVYAGNPEEDGSNSPLRIAQAVRAELVKMLEGVAINMGALNGQA